MPTRLPCSLALVLLTTPPLAQAAQTTDPAQALQAADTPITIDDARSATRIAGLDFSDPELATMLSELEDMRARIVASRARSLSIHELPALQFDPLAPGVRYRPTSVTPGPPPRTGQLDAERPDDLGELAFADLATLSALVKSKQVSCVELTTFFLERLRAVDEQLHCVVSYTEERALAQARALDAELAAGTWRGPLHGIPWGAKDLFATQGTRTTWGAKPYEDQVINQDATVVRRLDEAGAVLIAKLTLGALAYGDVWFDGVTRNPWNTEQGSSGSSAGPASAVAAGAVPFALGTETYGSLVSPSHRCGVSSLRPTFGRVSRHGAMALVWSMDKVGPMARSLDDAALVFEAIQGPDGLDPTLQDHPFEIPGAAEVEGLIVGVPAGAFDRSEVGDAILDELRALGLQVVEVQLPEVAGEDLNTMLMAESAAAFDELTRSDRDDLLVRQDPAAWPNTWRAARLIPAVDYINASRRRSRLMREMDAVMEQVHVLVHAPYAADNLLITNHTGHPVAVLPAGFREDGTPYAVSFTGRLFDETTLLAIAAAWQRRGDHHLRHPELP